MTTPPHEKDFSMENGDIICSRIYSVDGGRHAEIRFSRPVSHEDEWPTCICEIEYEGKTRVFRTSGCDTLDAFFNAVKMVQFNLECFQTDDGVQFSWVYGPGALGLPVTYDCPD
jgi:hypothetical protein